MQANYPLYLHTCRNLQTTVGYHPPQDMFQEESQFYRLFRETLSTQKDRNWRQPPRGKGYFLFTRKDLVRWGFEGRFRSISDNWDGKVE